MSEFNRNLKIYRERAGFSQAKSFADSLGIKYTTYAAYENLELAPPREPKYDILIKIANALHVSVDDLLGHKVDKEQTLFKRYKNRLDRLGYKVQIDEKDNSINIYKTKKNEIKSIVAFDNLQLFLKNMQLVDQYAYSYPANPDPQYRFYLNIVFSVVRPGVHIAPYHKMSFIEADIYSTKFTQALAKLEKENSEELDLYKEYKKSADIFFAKHYAPELAGPLPANVIKKEVLAEKDKF